MHFIKEMAHKYHTMKEGTHSVLHKYVKLD